MRWSNTSAEKAEGASAGGHTSADCRAATHNMIVPREARSSVGPRVRRRKSIGGHRGGTDQGRRRDGMGLGGRAARLLGHRQGRSTRPEALRDAGLAQRTARDAGDVEATVDDPNRDARTGVIGFEQIRRSCSEIHSTLAALGPRREAASGWRRLHDPRGRSPPPRNGSGESGWPS